ncbi:cytochrome c peroxidase [Thiorhodococcus fuscus]|uniref:Cytochrome c peroxidase n=1 Tax=Thiorhodococcus fuscus TaxID=527200 RepID=A0ABW4YED5_9GAMM
MGAALLLGVCLSVPVASVAADASAQVLAPGYRALSFPPPEPGSYRLPVIGPAAGGELLSDEGEPVRLEDLLAGHYSILSFIYGSCDDVNGCPLATAVLYRLFRTLKSEPELASQVRLLTLSFDPEHDTPEVMRLYGAGFQGGPADWRFLTAASDAALAPVLDAYGQGVNRLYDAQGRPSGRFAHVLRVFLIDPERRIRNIYSVSFLHPDLLLADLRTLMLEEAVDDGAAPTPPPETGGRALLARAVRPPLGLPPLPEIEGQPLTAEKVDLGRRLFLDRRLSSNGTLSCALCHIPSQGFTSQAMSRAVGMEGRSLRRNAASLFNVAYVQPLFLDGRERGLDTLAWQELLDPDRMGNRSVAMVLDRLGELPEYQGRFERAFAGRGANMETLGEAMSAYLRTLVSGNAPFDRWRFGGETDAMDLAAQRGFRLFEGKAGCVQCHAIGERDALFTDNRLHDTGIGWARSMHPEPLRRRLELAPGVTLDIDPAALAGTEERRFNDLGLYEVTQNPVDRWRFRTPSLRNIARTAPYMHDGSLPDLAAVVDYYDRGGHPHPEQDPRIRPLGLSADERADLIAFLHALTGDDLDRLAADAASGP